MLDSPHQVFGIRRESSPEIESGDRQCTLGHFIGGVEKIYGTRTIPVINPANGETIRVLEMGSTAVVDEAVSVAKQAFSEWSEVSPIKRARVMFLFKSLLETHAKEITQYITEEHGKTLEDARGELQRGIEVVEYACGIPELLKGEYTQSVGPGIDSWSQFQPLGVVSGITPFNFPAMVPLWMYPIAIASGNTFVLKPSELDPSTSFICAQLLQDAGLPEGVFNVVNGDAEAVDALLNHTDVKAVSFVGSTPVAQHVYEVGSRNGQRVQALGGAKNHAILMPDADLDQAVKSVVGAAFGSSGERCMAISVVVCVGDEVADAFIEHLRPVVAGMSMGDGTEEGVDMGPLISKQHLERVKRYIEIGVNEGAELTIDGRDLASATNENGYYLGPCVFDHVQPGMTIHSEEIFGPVLSVVRVRSQTQAMEVVDSLDYGNGTCIFTRDGEAARYFADNIHVGMVGINVPLPVPTAFHSFGGWKSSLFGALASYGPDAVRFYTQRKTITQRWPSGGIREQAKFAFPS